jgi:hypothetical protein
MRDPYLNQWVGTTTWRSIYRIEIQALKIIYAKRAGRVAQAGDSEFKSPCTAKQKQ